MSSSKEVRAILNKDQTTYANRLAIVEELDRIPETDWPARASIRVLRNFSADQLMPALRLAGYRRDTKLDVTLSDYDAYEQEMLDPSSVLRQRQPDVAVLALWLDNLRLAFDDRGGLNAAALESHVLSLVEIAKQHLTSQIVVHTFLPPIHRTSPWSGRSALSAVNQKLRTVADADPRITVVEFEDLLAAHGADRAIDPRYWFLFRSPLTPAFLETWADDIAQTAATIKGRSKKAIIVDCDNTLWGGIIGEDGINGIKLDPTDYPGSAFYALQRQILELSRSGVLVALCSKNNEADALDVLRNHPHCLIKESDLAAWRINWDNKAANLVSLAEELNIGLDSFVFLDDNAAECELVRQSLPMVDVLTVPPRPADIPSVLARYNGFLQLARTAEDAQRTALMKSQQARASALSALGDIDSFLQSLELTADIGEASEEELPRIAQLTQKTNQFNLTTRRYSLGEVTALAHSDGAVLLRMKAQDKHGDYGLIGAAIAVSDETGHPRIDTFLMSCRALGKRLEDAFLHDLLDRVRTKWGPVDIAAEYLPTPKNAQVADFYSSHGFAAVEAPPHAGKRYVLPADAPPPEAPDCVRLVRKNVQRGEAAAISP